MGTGLISILLSVAYVKLVGVKTPEEFRNKEEAARAQIFLFRQCLPYIYMLVLLPAVRYGFPALVPNGFRDHVHVRLHLLGRPRDSRLRHARRGDAWSARQNLPRRLQAHSRSCAPVLSQWEAFSSSPTSCNLPYRHDEPAGLRYCRFVGSFYPAAAVRSVRAARSSPVPAWAPTSCLPRCTCRQRKPRSMNPITIFAGQNAGASLGNLICPNNTVAACATVDQIGNESDVMKKKTLKAFAIILCDVYGACHALYLRAVPHVRHVTGARFPIFELFTKGCVFMNQKKSSRCHRSRSRRRACRLLSGGTGHCRRAGAGRPERAETCQRSAGSARRGRLSSAPRHGPRAADFSDLGECDVIVNSVGKLSLLRETHDRLTEMDFTIPAVRGYAEKIKASGFDGVLINITNPCDIVTRELALGLWTSERPSVRHRHGPRHLPPSERPGAADRR